MYYHVIIEMLGNKSRPGITHSKLNITDLNLVREKFAKPYILGEEFTIDGYRIKKVL